MGWRRIPRKLGKTVIISHKKGNIKYCEKYGSINLLNSGYKIYANIYKLYTYYKNKVHEEQNGF
jgi:hypothetical protein